MIDLKASSWNKRYKDNNIGWDIGQVSTPLKTYFDQIRNKSLKILIPGCGNAYEASYLFENGFKNVHILDFSEEAIESFKKNNPLFPKQQIHQEDFFQHQSKYDLIIEQTFFCALNPSLREDYVVKMHQLLNTKGKLAGLLFDREFEQNPPFGGNFDEYKKIFDKHFNFNIFAPSYNSILPRKGSELFFIFEKSETF